tara:strand:- start:344 stop:790 length:447 start_codon:yes stop_codon:yes gene_type:complete
MAIINSYAAGTPTTSDLILGVDTSNSKNTTKTFTAGDIASLASGSTAYDSYVALLTQAGTAAPVATVLSNNLTATLTWARTGVGVYTLTANAATFTANKTIIFINAGSSQSVITGERTSDTVLTVKTISGGAADSAITNGAFEVRIYT